MHPTEWPTYFCFGGGGHAVGLLGGPGKSVWELGLPVGSYHIPALRYATLWLKDPISIK